MPHHDDPGDPLDATIMSETPRNALPLGFRLHWYQIGRVLGQGGFGITYLATDQNLDVAVAIKEYLPGELSLRDADASVQPMSGGHEDTYRWGLERFMSEARTLARFKHPNIVEVRSVFEANNTAYMVMAYETGDSLAELLEKRGTLDEEELKAIALPILEGLAAVHALGFIHRDIKPSNIYLRRNGQPVLLDFGAARQAVGEHTRTMTSVFSPGYAPFEQYFSKSDRQGPWTDIYGMGATLYHGITGKAPLTAIDRSEGVLSGSGDTMKTAAAAVSGRYSAAFLAAIDHALAFRPEDRPRTIDAWRTELCAPTVPSVELELEPMTAPRREPRLSESELPQIRFDDERRHDRGRKQTPKVTAERRRVRAAIPIAVGALALLAVVGYLFRDQLTGGGRPDAPATRVQTSAPAQTVVAKPSEPEPQNVPTAVATSQPDTAAQERAARLETLAADANAAYAAGRLTGTDGDSAAEAYRAMIEIDSENEIAKTGLAQLATGLTAAAENALAAGQVDVASSAINQLSVVDPEATALPQLQASLQRVQEQRSKDLEVYQLLASAKEDYEAGRIIEPEGENALEKYREVESLRPGMGAVKRAYIDIGNFLIEQADQASSEERFDDAYRYLDTAKSILPDRPEIDDARQYVDNRKVTYDLKQRRQAQQ